MVRQLSGLGVRGRGSRRPYLRLKPRRFDIVVLDPPRWSRGAFGAVDVVRDYPSLFKPALLATADGGTVIATNHVAEVSRDGWLQTLLRCAEKAGRPIRDIAWLEPDADFPSFDQQPPLKIALCHL